MTAATQTGRTLARADARLAIGAWAAPLMLFGVALLVRVVAVLAIHFPISEGSAYYVAVARNLATGRGLVIDAIWSYATPPLTLPRPAFELWQPLASLLAAGPMAVVEPTYAAGQLGFAVVGALVAPLAWYLARDVALRLELPQRRASMVALGAGALAALCGPLVISSAMPDSTLPFTVLVTLGCIVVPRAVRGSRHAVVTLGALAGLAYLTRMEAIYLALAFLVAGAATATALRPLLARGISVAAVAAVVVAPWWLRNVATFGAPMPGQLSDNAFLTHNEQIFAWASPPTLEGFLAQGPAAIVGNVLEGFRHDVVDVLLIPAVVVATFGLVTLIVGRRHARAVAPRPLGALLVVGFTTLAVTSALFPVATLWGTFEHAAGPLLLALCVLAACGADAFVARLREWRTWPRSNAWLAQAALVALMLPLTLFHVSGAATQARTESARFDALGVAVPTALRDAGVEGWAPVITDRPVWLSDAMAAPAIALPAEPPAAVLDLARRFAAHAVVVIDERGPYPGALIDHPCFRELDTVVAARVFLIAESCR